MLIAFGLLAAGASLYLVYVLEILKISRFRRRAGATDEQIEQEVETGEWEAVPH